MPDSLHADKPSASAPDEVLEPDAAWPRTDETPHEEPPAGYRPIWVEIPAPRTRNRLWLHASLFGVTIVTTTYIGLSHWLGFTSQFGAVSLPEMTAWQIIRTFWPQGLWYSVTILLILGAHELGHYLACRYYGIDASPPYFIPVPPPVLTGTLGAFIRIRQPFPNRRVLFDVGIAGPLAGFVFAVPALFIGLALSNVAWVPPDMVGEELGEPIVFKLATWLIWGPIPDGHSVNLHPMAFAAWFGLLATVLNLFPIGQLDGGHVSYTVLGRRSATLTRIMVSVIIALVFVSLSWLLWAVLLVAMLFAFGVHHPPTLDDSVPLDRTRKILVVVALAIFILCFMSAPIQPLDLVR